MPAPSLYHSCAACCVLWMPWSLGRAWRQCSVDLLDLLAPQIRVLSSRPLSRFKHWNTVEVVVQGRGIGHFAIVICLTSPS